MSENNKLYYNSIASEYDTIMNTYPIHISIRKYVKNIFKSIVINESKVLDFGGGTGEDLHWLSENYNVTFLEPSEKMKTIAYNKALNNNYNKIQFVDTKSSDFKNFTETTFLNKFDAIIANFAVINSIKNLSLLSKKTALICKKNSDIFFVVLYRFPNLKISFFKDKFHHLIFNKILFSKEFEIKNKNIKNTIYIHSLKHFKQSFKDDFSIINTFHVKNSYFKIIHLKRKN